jgi:hypothetical protein
VHIDAVRDRLGVTREARGMALLDSVNFDQYGTQTVACPACGTPVEQRFYGPCPSCRTGMRERMAGEARDVDKAEYEPKMNVTPNAVAQKDD